MNQLSTAKRIQIVSGLQEGLSIRAISRLVGCSTNTTLKLIADLGRACATFHDEEVREVQAERVQCDEIWGFCYAKRANVPEDKKGVFGFGDVWTFVSIDADTKLVPSWLVGMRTIECARAFMEDLKGRLATGHRIQLTTDGHNTYLRSVWEVFKRDIDFGMLMKVYAGGERERGTVRYSPSQLVTAEKEVIRGNPNIDKISTSYVERLNLTTRMSMRRFTRLTNGFSKKVENLEQALAIYFTHYNWVRVHRTLKTTPAVAAGLAEKPWPMERLIGLLNREKSN
jgi:IS1 family transposase